MRKKLAVGILLLFVSSLTFFRMIRPGFFPMHDDMQAMRLLQMHKCITDGQIPCRWVPDMGYGYGYPQFNYYAPLPYYLMEIPNLLGFSILSSVKIGFIFSVLVGVVGMYLLASSLWGKYAGLISASFFALIPYRSVDMWARGAMGELWGLAFFPFIFLAIRKAVYKKRNSEVYLALSLAALFTSHNISTMIFLPFSIFWAVYLLIQKYGTSPLLFRLKNIKKLIFGFIWGFLISVFFVIPAWFEKNLVQIESLTGGYFDYRQHFVSLEQLFASNYWNFGSSQPGRFDEIHLGIGMLHWLISLVSIFILIVLKRKKTLKTVLILITLAFAASFMTHPKSTIFWQIITPLKFLQFPYRFLLISTFLFSLVAGSLVVPLKDRVNKSKKITILIISLLIFFNAGYFRPSGWIEINDSEKFSSDEWLRQQTISIYDYLPKTAPKAPDDPASIEPKIIGGKGSLKDFEKGTDWYRFTADISSGLVQIQLPIYYFPNWTVEVNGVRQDVDYNNELGLITFNLKAGMNEVYAKLSDTALRSFSNIVSLFAILYIPYHLTRSKKKRVRA